MAERPLYTLYKNLKAQNYDVPDDYNKFESALTRDGKVGADNRHAIYENLKAQNFDVPSTYERFYSALFEPRSKTSSRAKGGSVPMSAADRARFSAGAAANLSSANNAVRQAKRNIQTKLWQAKKFDGGRVTTRLKNPLQNQNVQKNEFNYNATTGKTGTYTTTDGVEFDNEYDAAQYQNQLDKQGQQYINAVNAGEIPSVFDVRDKNGNYDLQENINKNGTYLTEEGVQKQFDKKLEDAYARKKEIEDAIAEDHRLHGNPLLSYSASIGASNGRTAEQSDYSNKLATSLALVKQQIGAMEAVKQYPTSSWGEDVLKALDNTAFTAKTWDFGLTDFATMGQMERIKTKMDNNIPLSGSDKMLLKSKLGADAAAALEDEKMGNIYRWTKIAGQSLPFMADFFLTGGYGGITKGISRGALKFAAKRGMGKVSAAILKNTGIVAGDVIGSYAMAGTEQALKTGADIMQRHLGNLYQDEKGDYKFGTFDENGNLLHEGGESMGTALYKGLTSAMVENYTEKLFGHNYGIKKGAVNFMEKHGMNASAEFFKNIGKSGWYTNSKKWMEKFGINGFAEEVMEEEIGIPLHALLDGEGKVSDLLDAKKQLDIIGGMAISVGSMYAMGAGSRPVKGIYNRAQYYRFRNKVNVADSDAQNLMGDNWADIKDKIDNATNEQMGSVLAGILRQRDTMTKEQINAAVNYGVNLMKMRGYNIAKTAEMNAREITNEPTTAEEQHQADIDNAYSEGHDADDADKHDIQIQQEDQMRTLAAALGISEQQLSAMSDEELESLKGKDDKLDQAIYDYKLSSARYQGVVDDAQDKVDLAAHQAEQRVDMYTDQIRGSVRNATIKASGGLEDYGVYIISGNIATHDDGSIDVSNSDDMILYYDPTTNSVEHADATMFAELGEELPADDVKAQAVADAKENAIKEVAGIIDGTVEVGSQFNVTDTDGTEHTYEVLADYGDGTADVSIDGNVVENPYSLADLQHMKDLEDQKRLEAAKAEREQMEKERAAKQNQETEQSQPSFDFNQILNDNGNVVLADVLGNDGNTKYPNSQLFLIRDSGAKAKVVELKSDGTLVPHAVNKKDVRTATTMTLDEYKQAFAESSMIEDNSGEESDEDSQLANLGLPKGSEIWMSGDGFGRPKENTLSRVVGIDEQGSIVLEDKDGKKWSASFDYINNHRELPPLDENTNIVNEENNQSESNAEENTPAPEQTPAMTLEDGTIVPMLEDGNPDFSKLTAEQTAELYDTQFGEDAESVISSWVSDAKKALDKANNMTVKGKTFVEQKAAKDAKEKAIADAQSAYDSAVAIRDAYNERQLAKVEDTAEGRKALIEKARRKFARLKSSVKDDAEAVSQLYRDTIGSLLHRLYDSTGIDVTDTTPLTAEEYVASNLGAHSLNYEGTETSKGVKQETGLNREDFAKTQLLAADGKGTTIDALIHSLWENRPSNLESLDTQDIRNALIGVLTSGFKASEARNFVENIRIAQAENILEEQKRAQENADYAEQQKAEQEAELEAKSDEKAESEAKLKAKLDNESSNESNDLNNDLDNEQTNDKINDNINALTLEQKKAKEDGEKLGFPAVDNEGEPINQYVIELANWAKEQGLEIDPTSKWNNYADLFIMCKDGFGVGTLVPNKGESINQVVYFPDNVQGFDQLWKLHEEFNVGRDLKHSADMDNEQTQGAMFYYGDTAREFKEFVDKKVEEQNKVFGEQRPEEDLPFSAKENGKQQTNAERAADVEKNKVDDMKVVDNIIGQKTRKTLEKLAKMMGANVQWQYSDKNANGWFDDKTNTIYLTLDSSITEGVQFIFGHEMTHEMRTKNPAAYDELKTIVKDMIGEDAFNSETDRITSLYNENNVFYNGGRTAYEEEVVSDQLGKWIRDANYAHTLLLKMSHPLLAKLHEIVNRFLMALHGIEISDDMNLILRSIEQAYVKTANGEVTNSDTGEDVSYSLRQKPEPKKKGIGYKVFVLKDGKLYPPMVANPDGAATPVGVWLDADAAPIAGESKTGRPQVKQGGKGTQGGSGKLAYRPGWHLGVVPYAIQFNRKDADGNKTLFPKNFVFAEVEYAADVDYQEEARQEGINPSGKYQHSLAGLKHLPTDGFYMYRTNPNPETDPWVITGAMKVNRILTRAEQAELVKNAGREPQQIQDGDIVTDDVVKSINQEIADAPKFSIKTYHGSQASFDKFDHSFMGSGEGAQAYGWGTYVSEVEGIAKAYAKQNAAKHGMPREYKIAQLHLNHAKYEYDKVQRSYDNSKAYIDSLKEDLKNYRESISRRKEKVEYFAQNNMPETVDKLLKQIKRTEDTIKVTENDINMRTNDLEGWKRKLEEVKKKYEEEQKKFDAIPKPQIERNLYSVDIPDDTGENYIGWDEKMTPRMRDIRKEILEDNGYKLVDSDGTRDYFEDRDGKEYELFKEKYKTGGTFYEELAQLLHSQKLASLALKEYGFDGVKVIAQRNTGGNKEGKMNYVIFDENNAQITSHTKFSLRLKSAIEETETNPSDAQKESGNYKKGHIKFGGYDYTIENPKGSTRSGKDADGKEWKVTMHDTYGYIRGKFGKDGDHLDMFINDKADLDNWNGDVFVVDQVNPDGSFDEHKVMYGYYSMDDAKNAYLANYSDGWQGLGNITGASKDEFDKWLDTSNRKLKPFADYSKVKFSLKDIKPVGVGAFGNIYNQFRGNAKAAIEFLKKVRGGEAVGALHHKDIGDIDLVWGKEGTGHSDGYGLSKLVKYHPEVLDNLQEILNDMSVVSRSKNRVNLESETHKAGVRLTWDGERKSWLLTAFKKETSASDKRTDTAATSLEGDTALSQTEGSAAKIDNSSETAKKNGEKFSLKDEKIKSVAEKFGVNEDDVAMYANAVERGSTADAARARANIKRYLLQANEDKISSFKELMKYTVPVNKALKENFGDLDAMIEEQRKQVEAQRNAMEAARKRAQEDEEKRQKHLDELSLIPTDELDKRYMDAIANNDESTAREMLDESARRKGYGDVDSDYQGQGAWAAPSNPQYESDEARRADIENSPDVNLEDIALGYSLQPDDYFDNPRAYMNNTAYGLESALVIKNALDAIKNGEKDVKVKVYRAVPTSVKEGKLRNGDWVTPSKKYAEMHGDNRLEGKYRIIEDDVPANQLWWDGNDANEFGFDDGKEYRYKNAKNNRKLNDLITYDNKGNVIPPSKRFNSRKNDIRFSLAGERGAAAADKAEERTTRMDFLSVARKMEEEKKDAKAIKIATGWERGADGKWRFEIPDFHFNYEKWKDNNKEILDSMDDKDYRNVMRYEKEFYEDLSPIRKKNFDELRSRTGYKIKQELTLGDVLEGKGADNLFKYYPELRGVKFKFSNLGAATLGIYNSNTNTIEVNDAFLYSPRKAERNLQHEVQHVIQHLEGFAKGGNEFQVRGEVKKKFSEVIKQIRQLREEGKEDEAKAIVEKNRGLYNAYTKNDDYNSYKSLAGEVEARNVQERMNMTSEERRKTLAESTEDVARKDQIFLGVGDVSFSLRDMADGKESGVDDMAEDLKSLNTPDEVDDAIKTAIDDMPSGWQMANKKIIHIAQALGENRKSEIAGEEPKFSIRTYHGTGASFDKFDLSHAFEGEGSETFGHGVYVTNSSKIGRKYAQRAKQRKMADLYKNIRYPDGVKGDIFKRRVFGEMVNDVATGGSVASAKEFAKKRVGADANDIQRTLENLKDREKGTEYEQNLKDRLAEYKEGLKWIDSLDEDYLTQGNANRYDVDIPDDNGSNYLDWENPMSEEQINAIRDALSKNGVDVPSWEKRGFNLDLPFKKVYSVVLPMMMRYKPEDVSKFLSSIGFTGIKYPAGMIHGGAKEGDYNYVIFDENNANIVGNTRFSLRYDKFEHDLNQWKKDNNLPKDAQRPTIPQRNAGESAVDFLRRVDEYRKQMALWKTAPTYEQHLLSDDTALGEFNRELQRGSVLKRIAFQDSMLAIRKAQEAIMKEVGVDRLNMAEDAYTAENRSHGKGKNEFEEYNNEFLQPLRKAYHQMKKVLGDSYDNVRIYMMAKHGLERDAQMAFKMSLDADYEDVAQRSAAYKAYKGDMNRIINDSDLEFGRVDFTTWRQRDNALRAKYSPSYMNYRYDKNGIVYDYSGLSSLFDGSDFEEAAYKLVKDIEDKYVTETHNLWDATNAATKKILRDGYKAGMMSKDTYQYVRDMYSHYIPLRGWDGTTADQVWDYVGGGKGAFNQTLKTAHGRTSIADDPIAYIENMAESGILLNNKNWVKQHLMLLAQNHPTSLLTLSKAWYVKSTDANGNEEWIPATPQITSQMNSNQVKDAIDAFEKKMEQMAQTGDATQKRDGLNIAYPQTHSEEREHEVRVMKDGEEYVIYVNGDPQLAQAMNNTRAHRVREIQSGKLDRAAAWLGRKMAAAYTSLSPLFIPSNYFRDLTMTLASTAIREDAKYNYLLRKNLATSWNLGFMLRDYQNGKLRDKVNNGNATPKEQMFYDFMMNGGETGFVSSLDVEDLKKKFKNDLKDLDRWKANPVKVGHTIMDSIEFLNRAIEDSNRFAVYMTSIQYGRSIDEAVNDAKDVTLNFNRKGTGEYGWQMIRNLYLFINPAVQSLQTLGALAKHHPFKFTAVTASWLASGVLVPIVNAALMSLFGGDDDKDKYWQFSKWDRRNNFIMWIPTTNEFVKIPLAQEFRAFYGLGDMIASKMMGGDLAEESWSQYAEDLLGQVVDMLPLDPTGYDGNIAVSLMPNPIRPIFELAFNVDFTGKPLFKETEYNKYDPNFTKAYVGTPYWLVRASRMVNSIGNDYPDVQQNSIDAFGDPRYNLNNPAVVDHVLSSYLGGAYTMGSQVLGLLTKSLNDRKEIKVADIPLFSKFVSNPDDRPVSKKQGDEFWNMKENHDRAANTLSKLKKQAKVDGDYSMLERFYGSEEYKQYKQDDVKVKKYEEDKKKERAEESGEEYRAHKLNAEDIYKSHATPNDDFEDLKLKQLYTKLNGFKTSYDLLVDTAPSQSDGYYNTNKAAIDAIDEISLDKQEISELKKGFLDDGKDAYNVEDMKRIRELRKKILAVLEKANKVVVANQKANTDK